MRNVIIPNWKLRVEEVVLPYQSLVELLQQRIINILHRMYSISYADAYNIWMKAQLVVDNRIVKIIREIIRIDQGVKILLNRNPTISYGSILYMKVTDISFDYSMQIPLGVLNLLKADQQRSLYISNSVKITPYIAGKLSTTYKLQHN